ncbi:MAG TPA: sugar ABC transporter permease [Chloroflexia bacterium]|nr:sugar ABC transporter permease [Chloroflexia bacterium]
MSLLDESRRSQSISSEKGGAGTETLPLGVTTLTEAANRETLAGLRVTEVGSAKSRLGDLWLALVYMAPSLLIFFLFSFYPFIRSIWLSFNITDQFGETVRFNDVKYYSRILNLDGSGRDDYLRSILTTVEYTLMVVPLGIIAALALAMLATARVKGIGFFRTVFTSSVAISVSSAGVIWALIYSPSIKATQWLIDLLKVKEPSLLLDSSTALPAVAFMTVWTMLGFNFIITLSGIQAIPNDLYESSKIDGANGWNAFRYITIPLLTPTLLFLLIYTTIQCFQAFTQFYVLIGNEGPNNSTNVLVFSLFKEFWLNTRYGFASALSVVLFVILLVLTFVQFRLLDRRVHYQ